MKQAASKAWKTRAYYCLNLKFQLFVPSERLVIFLIQTFNIFIKSSCENKRHVDALQGPKCVQPQRYLLCKRLANPWHRFSYSNDQLRVIGFLSPAYLLSESRITFLMLSLLNPMWQRWRRGRIYGNRWKNVQFANRHVSTQLKSETTSPAFELNSI